MLFQDKLEILIKLSAVSASQLARAIRVDASTISRLRRGTRGLPHNDDTIREMAAFFARKLDSDYQRAGLAEITGRSVLRLCASAEDMADTLYLWMTEKDEHTNRKFSQFMDSFNGEPQYPSVSSSGGAKKEKLISHADCVFYGNAGRRQAVRAGLQNLLAMERACTILITSDEHPEWILENSTYSLELTASLRELANRGFKFRRISSPKCHTAEEALDKCQRWLPLYTTGQLDSFHYPRLKDDLFRRTLLVVPGFGAITANSIGYPTECGMTLMTFNREMTAAYEREYYEYEKMCIPLVKVHTQAVHSIQLFDCLTRYMAHSAPFAQQSGGLPTVLTPQCVLDRVDDQLVTEQFRPLSLQHRHNLHFFKECLAHNRCMDIISLADKDDIIAGNVPIPVSKILLESPLYYTVAEYKAHLKLILQYLDEFESYHVYIQKASTEDVNIMYAKEGHVLLLVRRNPPYSLFEITESNVVAAGFEYLLQKCGSVSGQSAQKIKTKTQIQHLLNKL